MAVKFIRWCSSHRSFSISVLCIFLSVGLIRIDNPRIPFADDLTDEYFAETIKLATASYAICRIVNAGVSVVKESEVEITPWGVGIGIHLGQLLDPLDDMTERLADVLVTSIASVTVQKVTYEISVWVVPRLLGYVLLSVVVLSWIPGTRIRQVRTMLLKVILLLVVARLFLPLTAYSNEYISDSFFKSQIEANDDEMLTLAKLTAIFSITNAKATFDKRVKVVSSPAWLQNSQTKAVEEKQDAEDDLSWLGNQLRAIVTPIWEKTLSQVNEIYKFFKAVIQVVFDLSVQTLDYSIKPIVELTGLYVAMGIVQVVIIPILSFWILVKLVNGIFGTSVPRILQDPLRAKARKEQVDQNDL